MQTQAAVEKKTGQASQVRNKPVQTRVISKKPSVRTTELKKMIDLVLKDPDSVSQQEFTLLQSAIGYRQTLKLMQDGRQRKRAERGQPDKTVKTPAILKGQKNAETAKPVNNPLKEEQKKSEPDTVTINKNTAKQDQNTKDSHYKSAESKPQASQKEIKKPLHAPKPQIEPKNTHAAAGKQEQKTIKASVEKVKAVKEDIEKKEQKKRMAVLVNGETFSQKAGKTAPSQVVQKASKSSEEYKQADKSEGNAADNTNSVKQQNTPISTVTKGIVQNDKAKKAPSKPAVKIKGEDPGSVLQQLGSLPPTEIVNAYSQATAVSEGALGKQRQKAQAVIPEIHTPTGLTPGKGPGSAIKKISAISHKAVANFKSKKDGGTAQKGKLEDFKMKVEEDTDADDVMAEARAHAANSPEIGMTGEADPSQLEGFKSEAAQNVQAAKQAELNQTNKDFGENSILPKEDNTKLKAEKPIGAVVPLGLDMKQIPAIPPDVAARVNPTLSAKLKGFMDGKSSEYQKGRSQFDSGIIAQKASTDRQIENEKTQAKEKQLKEQENAKAEVAGYRNQWKSEVETATAQYDKEASAESEGKKKEIGDIKKEKEGQVKTKLSEAEKDAEKECKTAKKDADKEKQEGEKKHKNWFEKAVDWGKEKIKQGIDFVKKAVSSIFDKLRRVVKTIFEKAKQAATALIEAGRKLIVNAIKGLGDILKKLVSTVFAKFPGISKKICGMIDGAVNKAVNAVNKAAAMLKKGVTAALDLMAKGVDKLFAGVQALYRAVMAGIKKFLSMDFMQIFSTVLEAAQIAAEIALAIASGGGSVLMQIVTWLATTLPKLLNMARGVIGFVDTIRSIKFSDIKQLLNPAGIGNFLVKGLFGELKELPQGEKEDSKDNGDKEPASGREEKGLMKVLAVLSKVFRTLKGVYGKVAGAINKVLPKINISNKPWFDPFSMVYAGAVKALEVVQNPAEALNEGAGKLKEATGNFFAGIKTKITETAGNIKQKLAILGQPAQMLKLIANKAVDMVLNFIITHPPSALIKAVFKGIEAVAGKSIVELVRQYIPFADKIFDKIAGSQPVQSLMKPLEGPVKAVGGAIDQVTTGATGMVKDAEGKTLSAFGNGAKILSGLAGVQGSAAAKGGAKKEGAGGKAGGGGDFFGTIKSGIHTRLMTFGQKLLQKGKTLVKAGVGKLKGLLTPKVKFKLGNESHELWVEKGKNKNVVMMASYNPGPLEQKINGIDNSEENLVKSKMKKAEQDPNPSTVKDIANTLEEGSAGVSEAHEGGNNSNISARLEEELENYSRGLNQFAQKLGNKVKSTDKTLAVGITDVRGLEGSIFGGSSPKLRKAAGLDDLDDVYPNRSVKAPYDKNEVGLGQFTRHAEEGVMATFEDSVVNAGINPQDVKGTIYIMQSNGGGVCSMCTLDLIDKSPHGDKGIFKQFTEQFPNLNIVVSTYSKALASKANGTLSFEVKNGVVKNVIKNKIKR